MAMVEVGGTGQESAVDVVMLNLVREGACFGRFLSLELAVRTRPTSDTEAGESVRQLLETTEEECILPSLSLASSTYIERRLEIG